MQEGGIPTLHIGAVALDIEGNPWIGTLGYGTTYFDGSQWLDYTLPVSQTHPVTPSQTIHNNAVNDIAIDGQNNKWFATDGSGVAVLDSSNSNWTIYDSTTSSLPDDFVYALTINGDTRWFGTLGGGVASLDTTSDTWQVFNTNNSPLPDDDVLAVAIDGNGGQWFAAYDAGLTYHGTLPETPPVFALDPFDTPGYTPGVAKAYNIWLDPDTYVWHVSWSGDQNPHDFTGTIVADAPITLVETLDFENDDSALVEDNVLTIYATETDGEDHVQFTLDQTATELTFALQIDGAYYPFNMKFGEGSATPPTAPFRLAAPQPQAPDVVLNATQVISEGQSVYLTGSFTDPDSFTGHQIHWDLGNGESMTDTLSVSTRYEDNGLYPVALTITDVHGAVGQAHAEITVENVAPEVYMYTDAYFPETELPIAFSGDFYDPGIHDSHNYLWDFGDGVFSTSGLTVTHVYTVPGTYSVTLTVADDDGGVGIATEVLSVQAINHTPTAVADSLILDEDTAVIIPVLDNDSDIDGDSLTVISTTLPFSGTAVINPDSSITYTPTLNINGIDWFSYTIDDGRDGLATAVVTVTIQPINDTPLAVDDNAVTDEDIPVVIDVLVNDSDVDGDSLTVSSVTQAGNGVVDINLEDGTVIYTPDTDFNSGDSADGTDSFTYTASDGQGASATATVVVTVNPVNDAPTAVADLAATSEDTAVVIPVLDNDSDIDGDTVLLLGVESPANGTVVINPATGSGQSLDSTVTYTPTLNFHGIDSFVYSVGDEWGATSVTTVTVTVNPVNDAPIAVDDPTLVEEDVIVTIPVLSNDIDVDGDVLTVTAVTTPTYGAVVINPDNSINYTSSANYFGPDSFTYTASDGLGGMDTATVPLTVTAVNDAPVAVPDEMLTAEETAVVVDVLANDSDVDGDMLTVIGVGQPTYGHASVNLDNTVIYTPVVNFASTDTFTYTLSDGHDATATTVVTITVSNENDNPQAVADTALTAEDTAVVIDVLANDSDIDGDALRIDSLTQPAHGFVVVNVDQTVIYTPTSNYQGHDDSFSYTISDGNGGAATSVVTVTVTPVNDAPLAVADTATTNEDTPVTIPVLDNDSDVDGDVLTVTISVTPIMGIVLANPDGTISYTPDANEYGADSFVYALDDGAGGTATAVVELTINPVNDAPTAVNDTGSTAEDTSVIIDVLTNDSDVEGDPLIIESVGLAGHGVVSINVNNRLTYTPTANYSGADSFSYTIVDNQGGSASAEVTVAVDPVNDKPVAADDDIQTAEDTDVTLMVLVNDSDVDGDLLTVSSVTTPTHGLVTINTDNSLTYTPNMNFHGEDSFAYTIHDGHSEMDTALVHITVIPVNDDPIAADDAAVTEEDSAVIIDVLANDSDVDGDLLLIQDVTQPLSGTVSIQIDNTLIYTPAINFSGEADFSYTLSDGQGGLDTARVLVTVTPGNHNPDAVNDDVTTAEDTALVIDVLSNDVDADGDALVVDGVTQPAFGSAIIELDGTVRYTPDTNTNGLDSFTYTINDGRGGADTATVSVQVDNVNDMPVVVDDTATTNQDTEVTIGVLDNDSDSDGDILMVDSVIQPNHGAVVINTDNTVSYTPESGFTGLDTFAYTASDGQGGVSNATVSVDVKPVAASCTLYPIALHASTLSGAQPGDTLPDIFNGTQPGNFGWLTWSGGNGVPTLVASLTPPGNSHTYVNPHNSSDHTVSVGDWIEGKPGVSNAKAVRKALDELKNIDIVVPVWDTTQGNGANTIYQVSGFAKVRILDYRLPKDDRITVQYLGPVTCNGN